MIVSAIFADLAANQGLAPGADVTFGGCSAGARGALLTLDYVGDMLPSGSTLKGLLDSGARPGNGDSRAGEVPRGPPAGGCGLFELTRLGTRCDPARRVGGRGAAGHAGGVAAGADAARVRSHQPAGAPRTGGEGGL